MIMVDWSPAHAPRIQPILDADPPVALRLWALLEGRITGTLLADSLDSPTWALLQEHADGTVYLGGALTAETLPAAVRRLAQARSVTICLWPDDPRHRLLPAEADYRGQAIDFLDRTPEVELAALAHLPVDVTAQPLTPALIPLLQGFDYYDAMFGSRAAAVAGTFGVVLLRDGQVLSEVVAGPVARGLVELGVGTAPAARRQGLATAAAALTIQQLEARGLRPFWNAAAHNTPSVALAARLGFQTARPFTVTAWEGRTRG